MIPPAEGFLETIREETEKRGIILIFDEIITGFRIAFGGAQERFGITADMTCLGKIIGGGLPVGAYGGRREIMETVAPVGAVYQAGTLSGNPLAMTAGYETVRQLQEPGVYERLENLASRLGDGLRDGGGRGPHPRLPDARRVHDVYLLHRPGLSTTSMPPPLRTRIRMAVISGTCWTVASTLRLRASKRDSCPWPIPKRTSTGPSTRPGIVWIF